MSYPHRTDVVASRREGGKRTTVRAVCIRGDFNGPSRTTAARAMRDGAEHEAQMETQSVGLDDALRLAEENEATIYLADDAEQSS